MGVMYRVVGASTSVTAAANDLLTIVPGTNRSVILVSVRISQVTKAQDANDSMCQVQICSGHTTASSAGSTFTPTPVVPGSAAVCQATARIFDTTIASAGTKIVLCEDNFDVRAGWLYMPTPEEREELSATISANRFTVRLPLGPAATMSFSVTAKFIEIG